MWTNPTPTTRINPKLISTYKVAQRAFHKCVSFTQKNPKKKKKHNTYLIDLHELTPKQHLQSNIYQYQITQIQSINIKMLQKYKTHNKIFIKH